MSHDQRAVWVLPGGDEAVVSVRERFTRADTICRQFRTHGRNVWQHVVTADGTSAGKRVGPPRVTPNNAWVAAAARLTESD